MKIVSVDDYLHHGCMRCEYGGTPECKVHNWGNELIELRKIVLECGLTEEVKWSVPCYTHKGKNIAIVSAFKDCATLSFFKGSLLKDPEKILVKPGESSQADRRLNFTNVEDIHAIQPLIKAYIFEAIEIEEKGLKVEFKKQPEAIPVELEEQFDKNPELKLAFFALTPGRQRGYILYFSAPKQSKTRTSRIEKHKENILNGIGMHDHYKVGNK